MFGKDKVKGHNRIIKGKSGFKVTRIRDFLRKKDENNTKRNIAIGSAVVLGAGGIALLLRKKGVNVSPKALLKKATDNTPKYPKGARVTVKNVVEDISSTLTPKTDVVALNSKFPQVEDSGTLPISSKYADRSSRLLVKKPINQNRIRAKDAVTNDPWNTPVKSIVKKESPIIKKEEVKLLPPAKFPKQSSYEAKPETIPDFWDDAITNKTSNSISTVVQPNSKTPLLLTGKKIPASRGNLYRFDNRVARRVSKKAVSDAVRIDSMEKTYKSIDPKNLAMRAAIKIDHYLKRPRKTSNLGAPPKPTSLEEVLSNPNVKQAKKKVEDRLSRAERRQLQRKAANEKKN